MSAPLATLISLVPFVVWLLFDALEVVGVATRAGRRNLINHFGWEGRQILMRVVSSGGRRWRRQRRRQPRRLTGSFEFETWC